MKDENIYKLPLKKLNLQSPKFIPKDIANRQNAKE